MRLAATGSGRRRRATRGQALTEFALAFPILILAILAVMETAYFALSQTAINHAAHEGGRVAALPATANETAVRTAVIAASDPIALATSDVSIEINDGAKLFTARATGDRVVVHVDHDHVPLVGLVFGNGLAFALDAESEFRVE
jgi:Flp pilus assembly protein TadG